MDKDKDGLSGLASSLIGIGLSSAILGGMMNMFGNRDEIPKGVVKEMMHGLMLGVVDLVNEKDYEIKELKDRLEQQKNDIKELTADKEAAERRYQEILKFAEDLKAKAEAKKEAPKKKK
jgi:hypothetical protein